MEVTRKLNRKLLRYKKDDKKSKRLLVKISSTVHDEVNFPPVASRRQNQLSILYSSSSCPIFLQWNKNGVLKNALFFKCFAYLSFLARTDFCHYFCLNYFKSTHFGRLFDFEDIILFSKKKFSQLFSRSPISSRKGDLSFEDKQNFEIKGGGSLIADVKIIKSEKIICLLLTATGLTSATCSISKFIDLSALVQSTLCQRSLKQKSSYLLKCFCLCFCWTLSANPEPRIPAGSAKKEMAKTLKQEATILPIHVCGTASPYPIVVTVIWGNIFPDISQEEDIACARSSGIGSAILNRGDEQMNFQTRWKWMLF